MLNCETREALKTFIGEKAIGKMLKDYPSPRYFLNLTEKELASIPYVGKAKARRLSSVFELCRLLMLPEEDVEYIKSSSDVFHHLKAIGTLEEERFFAIYLTNRNRIIDTVMVSKGLISFCMFGIREFYSHAVRLKASSVIAVHNHPGGSLIASAEDINCTRTLKESGKFLGISFLDHVIIAGGEYMSMNEKGLF